MALKFKSRKEREEFQRRWYESATPVDPTDRFAWPPQYRIEPTSCRCGGSLAWMQKRATGMWEMIGCVCHLTPSTVVGVTMTVET